MNIKEAMSVVTKAIREDEGYRIGWKANIAMAFKDEWDDDKRKGTLRDVHTIANDAADRFLNLLCREDS